MKTGSIDYLGSFIIICSSMLLGIWAVKHTIALRQALLGLGCALSIIYSYSFLKKNFRVIEFVNWIPSILLAAPFFWVIVHCIFLSEYPSEAYLQLRSTWLRSLLAIILAFGCGIAVLRSPEKLLWLWFGVLFSFIALYFQYIQKALTIHSIFAPDYDGYMFYGKINGVLMGTLSLAALGGILIDKLRDKNIRSQLIKNYAIFFSFIFFIVLYSYIFIFDSRNGSGIAVILFLFFLVNLIPRLSKSFLQNHRFKTILILLISIVFCAILIGGIYKAQNKFNQGWNNFFEDITIAVQIDKHPNWINFDLLNYPKRESGDGVRGNTYVRFAWAAAGVRLIYQNPMGVGTTKGVFGKILDRDFGVPLQGAHPLSTHSGVLDLTLAYGLPFLVILLGLIGINVYLAITKDSRFKVFILAISLAILTVYSLGELSGHHAIEILFFLLGLISALNMFRDSQLGVNIK